MGLNLNWQRGLASLFAGMSRRETEKREQKYWEQQNTRRMQDWLKMQGIRSEDQFAYLAAREEADLRSKEEQRRWEYEQDPLVSHPGVIGPMTGVGTRTYSQMQELTDELAEETRANKEYDRRLKAMTAAVIERRKPEPTKLSGVADETLPLDLHKPSEMARLRGTVGKTFEGESPAALLRTTSAIRDSVLTGAYPSFEDAILAHIEGQDLSTGGTSWGDRGRSVLSGIGDVLGGLTGGGMTPGGAISWGFSLKEALQTAFAGEKQATQSEVEKVAEDVGIEPATVPAVLDSVNAYDQEMESLTGF